MRWGLVGTGAWAQMVHAPSLAAHPDQRQLVAVWGRDAGKSAALAQAHGADGVRSIEELLDRVDAVSFAVAPDVQAPLAARAVDRGLRVLLEKPVATRPAVVQQLADALRSPSDAVVFLSRLFEPERARWLREVIGGRFTGAHVEQVSAALSAGSVYADSAWRRGTGVVWDLVPHVLSQVVPVLGDVADGRVEPWPEHDGVLIELQHAGGSSSRVRLTLSARPEQREEWIRFDGPGGATRSPAGALDFVAAHTAAARTLEAGADLRADPLLRMATVAAAIQPTVLMSSLVHAYAAACPAVQPTRSDGALPE